MKINKRRHNSRKFHIRRQLINETFLAIFHWLRGMYDKEQSLTHLTRFFDWFWIELSKRMYVWEQDKNTMISASSFIPNKDMRWVSSGGGMTFNECCSDLVHFEQFVHFLRSVQLSYLLLLTSIWRKKMWNFFCWKNCGNATVLCYLTVVNLIDVIVKIT